MTSCMNFSQKLLKVSKVTVRNSWRYTVDTSLAGSIVYIVMSA